MRVWCRSQVLFLRFFHGCKDLLHESTLATVSQDGLRTCFVPKSTNIRCPSLDVSNGGQVNLIHPALRYTSPWKGPGTRDTCPPLEGTWVQAYIPPVVIWYQAYIPPVVTWYKAYIPPVVTWYQAYPHPC